jgi:hypothetical protein
MLDLYLLELSQDRYRPSIVQAARTARTARKQQKKEDTALLARVDAFTESDDDVPMPKRRSRRR